MPQSSFSSCVVLLAGTLLLVGCGAVPLAPQGLAAGGDDADASGISTPAKLREKTTRAALVVIAGYDKSDDGAVSREETPRFREHEFTTLTTRLDESWVLRTTIYYDVYQAIRPEEFHMADTNGDRRVTVEEMVESYFKHRDSNDDGKLGWWERLKGVFNPLSEMFEEETWVETDRKSRREYEPNNRSRPAPLPSVKPR